MRLWTLISGYDDASGLERACESVRRAWPDADRAPIIYSDGAYARFPHESPRSSAEVLAIARHFAAFTIEWPVAAPTEFLKRSSYWCGLPGDYGLILDTDEEIRTQLSIDDLSKVLTEEHYTLDLLSEDRGNEFAVGNPHRLFRISEGIHHWGAHFGVFVGEQMLRHGAAKHLDGISILHRPAPEGSQRWRDKHVYYQGSDGLQVDEGRFYTVFGT